ncbi:MAG: alpha-L-arabinofuranosidase C-terminal domain-containing protein, partial [Candidatus Hermodarchaeota archaeon]
MLLQKNSDICPIANWAQLVNCIGIIQTDPNGLILTPVFLAFKLFTEHMHDNLIKDISVNCPIFNSNKFGAIPKYENVPIIACNATIDNSSEHLSIMLVNKHFNDNLKINLEIKEFLPKNNGSIIKLTSNSPFDYNTIENRNKIKIIENKIDNIEPNITIDLDPHSITILKLSKKQL